MTHGFFGELEFFNRMEDRGTQGLEFRSAAGASGKPSGGGKLTGEMLRSSTGYTIECDEERNYE